MISFNIKFSGKTRNAIGRDFIYSEIVQSPGNLTALPKEELYKRPEIIKLYEKYDNIFIKDVTQILK